MSSSVRPQTMIAVTDVEKSSAWYCAVLGATSGHGGSEYEQILVDGELVLQLHKLELGHHHGAIGDPARPLGNGVALWFQLDALEPAIIRADQAGTTVQTALHHNPNAHHDEIWLRDPDNYLVVLAN